MRQPRLPSQLTYNDLNGEEATSVLVDWFRQLLASQPLLQPHLTLPHAKMTLDIHVAIDMYSGGTVPVASPPERTDITGAVTLSNIVDATPGVLTHSEDHVSTVINASPQPGGQPPDAIREAHDLAVPRPQYGPRETGSHLFLSDTAPAKVINQGQPPVEVVQVPSLEDIAAHMENTGGREGVVAEGYVFAPEPAVTVSEQVIPVDKGAIQVDLAGRGIDHAGIHVSAGTHRQSVEKLGDQKGQSYESVNGVYDAGPVGLMRPGRGQSGLYGDGRPRISFGNSHRG